MTPFSGAGPTETGFVKPDVIAPGAHMLVQMRNDNTWALANKDVRVRNMYYQIAGTSASAAVTNGVVAFMLDANPDIPIR